MNMALLKQKIWFLEILNCIAFKQQHGNLLSVSTCELYDMFFRQFSSSYAFRHLSNFPVFSTAISTQSSGGPMQTDILHTAQNGVKNFLDLQRKSNIVGTVLQYFMRTLIHEAFCSAVFRFQTIILRLICTLQVPCKIYPIYFRVAKAPEIFQGMAPIFSDLPYETQRFLRLPPKKISGAFATLKRVGQILQGS